MILKNGEPFKLATHQEEIKTIEKHFHNKFPVKIIYPPDRIVPSRLAHNKLPDKPNSISFDYLAIVKTDNGADEWRYVENIVTDKNGNKRYFPKKFIFKGTKFLDRNDIEKIFFLLRKSEFCGGGDNEGKSVKFVFEDLVTEAEKRAEKKRIEVKVNGLIYGEDFGLTEVKLRDVAKAYQIPGVDTMTLAQVQEYLSQKIHETKNGIDEFFSLVNAEDEIKTRMSITQAMDLGLLKLNDTSRQWYWQRAGEKGTTNICKTPPDKSPTQALYDYYKGNEGFRDDVQAVILTKNPDAGKVAKGKKAEVVPE